MRTAILSLVPVLVAATFTGCGGGSDGPVTVALYGRPETDGWVSSGGMVQAPGDVDMGDFPSGQGTRAFVSFELAPIPAGATVLSATMTLRQYYVGGSPYAKLGSLLVDHVIYGTVLEAGAYTRTPLASAIGVFSTDATLGPRSLEVKTYVQDDLLSGHPQTQYRLRFPIESDGDATGDFCDFYGATTADATLRPVLVVTYER